MKLQDMLTITWGSLFFFLLCLDGEVHGDSEGSQTYLHGTGMPAVDFLSSLQGNKNGRAEQEEDIEMKLLVEETMRLIQQGLDVISLDNDRRDLVLLVGNTGVGKTTLAKFLTEVDNLEAYDDGDRILIREINPDGGRHKINVGSTLISHTIFPDCYVDRNTSTVFYDMPGFRDTRNASAEIANALFMKMVADHARRVKIVFVVNQSSVRGGESRTGFKNLLENAVDYVKDPAKFHDAIGLIATKVESRRNPHKILNDIVRYINQTAENVNYVFPDEGRRQKVAALLQAFLATGAPDGNWTNANTNNPTKISFFRQPDDEDEGPLINIKIVMAQLPHIQHLVYNSLRFVPKNNQDFGLSLSHRASIVLHKVVAATYAKVTDAVRVISLKMDSGLSRSVNESGIASLGGLIKTLTTVSSITKQLSSSKTRDEYFQILKSKLPALSTLNFDPELGNIAKYEQRLKLLEAVATETFPPTVQWTLLMEGVAKKYNTSVVSMCMAINRLMEKGTTDLGNKMTASLEQRVLEATDSKALLNEYELLKIQTGMILDKLEVSTTFNEFTSQVLKLWNAKMRERPSLPILTEDVSLNEEDASCQFHVSKWIEPFKRFLHVLDGKHFRRAMEEHSSNHRAAISELRAQILSVIESQNPRILKSDRW